MYKLFASFIHFEPALHFFIGAEQFDDVLPVLLYDVFGIAFLGGLLEQIVIVLDSHLTGTHCEEFLDASLGRTYHIGQLLDAEIRILIRFLGLKLSPVRPHVFA